MGQAAEIARDAHRPVQRGGLQLDFVHDFINELEWLAAHAVPLVDHCDDGQPARLTNAEELEGLWLEALGGIDKHHCGIYRGEHAVGILRKVRVTWGINQVDHIRIALVSLRGVFKLQRGRGDGDTAVFLHVHPVRHGGLAVALAVDRAGLINHVRMQRQRLRQRGLTGIRVGDNGERAAARGLKSDRTHAP